MLSLYAVDSVAPGARNDERLEGLPPPGEFDAAAEAAADAKIDGANTSYAEALQTNNHYSVNCGIKSSESRAVHTFVVYLVTLSQYLYY